MCSMASTGLPGSRRSTSTSRSLLMWRSQHQLRKIALWGRTFTKLSSSSFSQPSSQTSLEVQGNAPLGQSSSGRGNPQAQGRATGWVVLFYMSFHSKDCVKYLESGRCSNDEIWSLLQNTLKIPSTCKWPTAHLWRSASARSSFVQNASFITCLRDATRRSCITMQSIATHAMITVVDMITHTVGATNTKGSRLQLPLQLQQQSQQQTRLKAR